MRVIAKSTLKEFWERHPSTPLLKVALETWYDTADDANWNSMNEVVASVPGARNLGNGRASFKILGNSFRLIVKIEFHLKMVFIRFIGTHEEYDNLKDATTV